jgi:hypothetical protein
LNAFSIRFRPLVHNMFYNLCIWILWGITHGVISVQGDFVTLRSKLRSPLPLPPLSPSDLPRRLPPFHPFASFFFPPLSSPLISFISYLSLPIPSPSPLPPPLTFLDASCNTFFSPHFCIILSTQASSTPRSTSPSPAPVRCRSRSRCGPSTPPTSSRLWESTRGE